MDKNNSGIINESGETSLEVFFPVKRCISEIEDYMTVYL